VGLRASISLPVLEVVADLPHNNHFWQQNNQQPHSALFTVRRLHLSWRTHSYVSCSLLPSQKHSSSEESKDLSNLITSASFTALQHIYSFIYIQSDIVNCATPQAQFNKAAKGKNANFNATVLYRKASQSTRNWHWA